MESEDVYDDAGYVGPNVPARVDWYFDEGKAVKQVGSQSSSAHAHVQADADADASALGRLLP
jgi:hypothetical protein